MESRQERYHREHLENEQFEEQQRLKDLEHLKATQKERDEQIDILKAYMGDDFKILEENKDFALLNVCHAMEEYALNKINNCDL